MFRKVSFTLALSLVVLAGAYAQNSGTRVGLGISMLPQHIVIGFSEDFNDAGLYNPVTSTVFSVPVELTSNIRIEPELGFTSYSSERGTAPKIEESSSIFRLGASVCYLFPHFGKVEDVQAYAGIRLAMVAVSSEYTQSYATQSQTTSHDRTDILYGLACGAEYYFSKNFSLGGEVQLNALAQDDINVSYTSLNSMITLRWFVF